MENQILDQDQVEGAYHNYASFWIRLLALLVDGLVFIPVYVLEYLNNIGWKSQLVSIILTISYLFYKIGMEGNGGATLGKRALNIKVVRADGQPMNYYTAAMRNCFFIFNTLVSIIVSIMIYNSAGFDSVNGYSEYNNFSVAHSGGLIYISVLLICISVIVMFFNPYRQTLHDKIGKTYVVIN